MARVNETAAGKAIGAWVIMRGAKHIATVRAHYGNAVTVDVIQYGKALERSQKTGDKLKRKVEDRQTGRAGGYGYDKFAAALAGLIIDGHQMNDHCGKQLKPPHGAKRFPQDYKPPRGYHLNNWDRENGGYMSCYRSTGLRYLEEIGYSVIQAI